MNWRSVPLAGLEVDRIPSVDPRKLPNEEFVLYSIPAHDKGGAERLLGSAIGSSKKETVAGRVLLSGLNPRINRVRVVEEVSGRLVASTEWFQFAPTADLSAKFLAYQLQQERWRRHFAENVSGVGGSLMRLRSHALQSVLVVFPDPREQERIVAAIETHFSRLDAAVALLTRAKANVKRARVSVLKAAVEGRLVPTEAALARAEGRDYEPASTLLARILAERKAAWSASGARGKYREPEVPGSQDLPALPGGWAWVSVQQLSLASREPTYGVVKLGDPVEGGVPVLRSSNVRALSLDLEYVKPISPIIENQYTRTRLRGGELLVTVRGTLGGVVVVPSACAGWNVSREVAVVAFQDPSCARFIAISFKTPVVESWIAHRLKGIAYTGLNIETLKQVPVPLPPFAEQHRIVAEVDRRLSVLDALDAALDANLARCARLRQAVLKRAFEGRLVPSDGGRDVGTSAGEAAN